MYTNVAPPAREPLLCVRGGVACDQWRTFRPAAHVRAVRERARSRKGIDNVGVIDAESAQLQTALRMVVQPAVRSGAVMLDGMGRIVVTSRWDYKTKGQLTGRRVWQARTSLSGSEVSLLAPLFDQRC